MAPLSPASFPSPWKKWPARDPARYPEAGMPECDRASDSVLLQRTVRKSADLLWPRLRLNLGSLLCISAPVQPTKNMALYPKLNLHVDMYQCMDAWRKMTNLCLEVCIHEFVCCCYWRITYCKCKVAFLCCWCPRRIVLAEWCFGAWTQTQWQTTPKDTAHQCILSN